MKKIILLLMALCLIGTTAVAQNSKELEKQLKKEYKLKMKELKKGGWQLYGSSRSLEVMLLQHYNKLGIDGGDAYEIMGNATNFISKNVGHQMAVNNACNNYARQASSVVRGRIVSDMSGNGTDASGEFDHFYAAYETSVEKEIRGEMTESFSVIRQIGQSPKGQPIYEMQTFFIISESEATRARLRALENAQKESEAAQRYAKKVSDFVREGFTPSNDSTESE